MDATFRGGQPLSGEIGVPSDKSISHRAAILGALADGISTVGNYSPAVDCASTLSCLEALGVGTELDGAVLRVRGTGAGGLCQPAGPLDAGNSGTTMRLLSGVVASRPISATITGDYSLRSRPMSRIIEPLSAMGARIEAGDEAGHPPLRITGGGLVGIDYEPSIASAQVKSCVLLAGLGAKGPTTVREKVLTRDHTERLLSGTGVEISRRGLAVTVLPGTPRAFQMDVPGDFSSAAFLLAAALLVPGSRITVSRVGLNPTRTGFLDVIRAMGAEVEVDCAAGPAVEEGHVPSCEPAGVIRAGYSGLVGIEIGGEEVARAIDEITLIALLATRAEGRTVIRGARELRFKESDRIRSAVAGLRALGAVIEEEPDGMVVEGPCGLRGATVSAAGDHRIAMMLAVAGLAAVGETVVSGWESTAVSYPGFLETVRSLGGDAS
ncbi:MAG: 3-phosphoshikimate 1-carboxyvinyltransferase [Actinomycetota bacterium]